jgi:hypothetical protein
MERVLATLRLLPSDPALHALSESIENDRARLLALAMGSHLSGREPPRLATAPPEIAAPPPRPFDDLDEQTETPHELS